MITAGACVPGSAPAAAAPVGSLKLMPESRAAAARAEAATARAGYGALSSVGVTATSAVLDGRTLTVGLRARRTVELRLAIAQGNRTTAFKKLTVPPGRYRLTGRLNVTPRGSGLRLRITAQIGGTRGRAFRDLKVTATPPPADRAPVGLALSAASVAENQPAGAAVGTFSGLDPDFGDTLSYRLVPGAGATDNGAFALVGNALQTAVPLDFETLRALSVRVQVSDGRGGSLEKVFTIAVTDANDAPRDLVLSAGSVPENQPAGTAVGTLSASDEDAGDTPAYAFASGTGDTDNGAFTLAGGTLRTAATFDRETKGSYTVRVRATDRAGAFTERAFTITVTDVDDAPVLTGTATPLAYTENDPATPVDPAVAAADVDSATLASAVVQISTGLEPATDALLFTAQSGITGAYAAGTGRLTLTGVASVADYTAALRSVRFVSTSEDPGVARTVSFTVDDGSLAGAAFTRAIALTKVNDVPQVTTGAGSLGYTEGDPATPVDGGATVTDPDSAVTGATVQITGGYASSEDVLALPAQPGITAGFDSGTGTLTLSGTATAAAYQAALQAVTYRNTSSSPSTAARTVTFIASDASGPSAPATRGITISATDSAPDVTTAGGAGYTENDPATVIDGALTVTDPDSANLTGATVQVTGNHAAGEDVLAMSPAPPITASFNATTGTLTLSGTASVAAYQAALRSVTYADTSDDPSVLTRTVTYQARDASGFGLAGTDAVTVAAVDDPPVAVADSATVLEDSGAGAVGVLANDTDVDGGPKSVASVTQPADGTVVITGGGTGVSYAPNANYCNSPAGTADTFTYTLNGGSSATVSMTVTCVDDPPVAVADSATVLEDSGAGAVGVLANDTDVDGGPKSVASVTQPADGAVVITGGGTGVSYAPNANYCNSPAGTADTFTYTLNGGSSATVSVTVTCVDDPPVAVADSATVLEDSGAGAVDVLANDTDIDGGPKSVASVTQPADGAVVITGGGTGVSYTPNANACNAPPGTTPDTFTYTLNGGSSATVSMTVTCVNDAPVAGGDSFTAADAAIGNTTLVVDAPGDGPPSASGPRKAVTGNILANDSDVDGPNALAVVPGTVATHDGGSAVLQADGDFVYTPAAGTSCTDHADFFAYTVTDGATPTPGTATGQVDITITGCVQYVDNNAAGNAGTSTAPFDTLAQAQTASAAGDTIFVFGGDGTSTGLSSGIALKDNQRLIGEAADLTVGGATLWPGTPALRPALSATNTDVVALASGDTVRGVSLNPNTTGSGIAGTAGDTAGTIDDVRIVDAAPGTTSPQLSLNGTAGSFAISDLTVDNTATGTGPGVVLTGTTGPVTFASAGTISLAVKGGIGLDASGTNLTGSVFDSITVTGSTTGGVRLVNTTGAPALGDGSGTDLSLTTTGGATGAFVLSNAGAVTVPSGGTADVSATGGPAVDVNGAAGASLAFDTVSSTGSATTGVNLDTLGAGTFSATGGTLAGFTGTAFRVNGGSGDVTYPGTIDDGAGNTAAILGRTGGVVTAGGAINDSGDAGGGISLSGDTGGSTVFSNATKTLSTGASDAVLMTGSDGHTLRFTGGGLAVTTTSGRGLEASASGTLEVSGAGNTIDSTTGRALKIASTDISANNVTFQRIASSGAPNGIVLDTTGALGHLAVTGAGGTCTAADHSGCSGGQIQNTTGADDSTATPVGTGVVLNATLSPALTRMWLHDNANYAIRGTAVSGLALDTVVIDGVNGTNGTTPYDDSSVRFDNLTGSASVTNSAISGGYEDNFKVVDAAGSLNRITFTGDTVGLNSTAGGNDGVSLQSSGTASLQATIQGSTFTGAGGDLVDFNHGGSGTGDLVISGSHFSNNHPAIATGGGGLTLSSGGASGPTTMNLSGNDFRDAVGPAVLVVKSTGASTQTGTFSGNTIGVNGVADSGSVAGDGLKVQTAGGGTSDWTVTNNVIRGYNNFGVERLAGGSATAQGGIVDTTVTGNTIDQPGTSGFPMNGIHFNIGTVVGDTYQACAVIGGAGALANAVATSGSGADDIRVRQRQSTTFRLPGYAGAATDSAAVAAFLVGNNPAGGPTALASFATGFAGGAPSSCP